MRFLSSDHGAVIVDLRSVGVLFASCAEFLPFAPLCRVSFSSAVHTEAYRLCLFLQVVAGSLVVAQHKTPVTGK